MNTLTTIVNFITDEKFTDGIIAFNEKYSPYTLHHRYLLVTEHTFDDFIFITRKEEIEQIAPNDVITYLCENKTDAVLLHNIYSLPIDLIGKIPGWICVIWSSWGFDLYSKDNYQLLINIELFGNTTREALGFAPFANEIKYNNTPFNNAVNRIDYISTVLPEEYDMIPSLDFFHAKPLHYTYISPDEVEKYQRKVCQENHAENILIGNSGDCTNNHLDIFRVLSKLDIGSKKIYCPLSYAEYSVEYREKVINEGKRLFGDNFMPMLDFIEKKEYFSIVSSCGYVFFGHLRQQALGNIRETIMNGCKLFLNENSTTYHHFKKMGVTLFSIQKDVTQECISSHLTVKEIKNNIDRMKQYTSPVQYKEEMSALENAIKNNIKISIIIPVYNVERYLRTGLESIINQTYHNLDIVCIDDGSTDDCYNILKDYAANDKRIKVIHQENSGTVIARQAGVKAASGAWCLFFDPDDWLELNTCEAIVNYIECTNCSIDVLQYGFCVEQCEDELCRTNTLRMLNGVLDEVQGADTLLKECYINRQIAWNLIGKCYRMDIVKKAFSKQSSIQFPYATDVYATYFLLCFSNSYSRISDNKFYHYRWGSGISTKNALSLKTLEKSLNLWNGYLDIKDFTKREFPDSEIKTRSIIKEIKNIMSDALMNLVMNRLDSKIGTDQWVRRLQENTDINIIERMYPYYKNKCDENKRLRDLISDCKTEIMNKESYIQKYKQDIAENIDEISILKGRIQKMERNIEDISEKSEKYKKLLKVSVVSLSIVTIILSIIIIL